MRATGTRRAGRSGGVGTLLAAAGWWIALGAVFWACFLAPPPRSLPLTLTWLLSTPTLVASGAGAMGVGGALALRAGRGTFAGFTLLAGLAWGLAALVRLAA